MMRDHSSRVGCTQQLIEELSVDIAVITGTILVQSALALVLFDSGSTHTLAKAFVENVCMRLDNLGYILVCLLQPVQFSPPKNV